MNNQPTNESDSRYKSLYEGSQLSLAEMTAHQGIAFNRISDLRNGIILALKRTFPRLFADAEAQSHQRMSLTSDAVLIAYLDAFLGTIQVRTPRPEGVEDLRAALQKRGIEIPAYLELSQWAALVNAIPLATPTTSTPPASFTGSDDLSSLFPEEQTPRDEEIDYDASYEENWDDDTNDPAPPISSNDTNSLAELFAHDEPSEVSPLPGQTMKPQLPYVATPAPPARSQRATKQAPSKKATRVKAQPPDPLQFDVPAETPALDVNGKLTNQLRDALVAATCIPRPVFLADLENIAGSRDVLDAWAREGWEDPHSPVGFISAKPRHRARGSLVFPKEYAQHAAPEFNRSLWAACINNHLTGARLYETAVLLHRIGAEVTNWHFSPSNRALVLTLSQRRGLVALIVVLEQNKSLIREALISEIEKTLTQQLVMTSVLVTHDPNYTTVRSILLEEAEIRNWRPTFPVTMARSWEFGLANTTMDLVLGD